MTYHNVEVIAVLCQACPAFVTFVIKGQSSPLVIPVSARGL